MFDSSLPDSGGAEAQIGSSGVLLVAQDRETAARWVQRPPTINGM